MRIAIFALLGLFSSIATAATMSFEGVVADTDTTYDVLTYTEGDYRLSQSYTYCEAFDYPCFEPNPNNLIMGKDGLNPFNNPSNDNGSATFSWTNFFGPLEMQFRRSDQVDFNLDSIDYALSDTGSGSITIRGFYQGSIVEAGPDVSVTLSAGSNWNTYFFDSGWDNIDFILIDSAGFDVAIDNISTSVVPLPAAAWLFGSALAGLGWIRRRTTS